MYSMCAHMHIYSAIEKNSQLELVLFAQQPAAVGPVPSSVGQQPAALGPVPGSAGQQPAAVGQVQGASSHKQRPLLNLSMVCQQLLTHLVH